MDYRRIEDLLEKYWSCETSIEEEEELRAFYTKQEIPEPFSRFKTLFIYQKKEKETGLNNAFDQKILRKIEQSTKRQFFPPRQIADGLLLLVGIAGLFYTTTLRPTNLSADTFHTPEEALEQVKQTLTLVSQQINQGQQKAEQSIEKTEILIKYLK